EDVPRLRVESQDAAAPEEVFVDRDEGGPAGANRRVGAVAREQSGEGDAELEVAAARGAEGAVDGVAREGERHRVEVEGPRVIEHLDGRVGHDVRQLDSAEDEAGRAAPDVAQSTGEADARVELVLGVLVVIALSVEARDRAAEVG